jgi:hypothetical protein
MRVGSTNWYDEETSMRNGILAASLFSCLFAWSAPPAAAAEATSAIIDLTWKLSLDANGRVQELSTTDERVPKLHAAWRKPYGAGNSAQAS